MNRQIIKGLARELTESRMAMEELRSYIASLETILNGHGHDAPERRADEVKPKRKYTRRKRELTPQQLAAMRANVAKGRAAQAERRNQEAGDTFKDASVATKVWTPERRAHQGEIMRKRHKQWKREGRDTNGQPLGVAGRVPA